MVVVGRDVLLCCGCVVLCGVVALMRREWAVRRHHHTPHIIIPECACCCVVVYDAQHELQILPHGQILYNTRLHIYSSRRERKQREREINEEHIIEGGSWWVCVIGLT